MAVNHYLFRRNTCISEKGTEVGLHVGFENPFQIKDDVIMNIRNKKMCFNPSRPVHFRKLY